MKKLLKDKATLTCASLTLSAFTLIAFHFPVFRYAAEHQDGGFNGLLILGGAALIMLALNFMVYYLILYLGRIVGKVLLSASFICNAIMLYFVVTYETLVTDSMMGNVYNTRFSEASGFFSLAAVLYILFLGIPPCLYLFFRKVEYGKFKSFLLNTGVALLVALMGVGVNATNFTWIDKHATELGSLLMPWSYIVNTVRYYNKKYKAENNTK